MRTALIFPHFRCNLACTFCYLRRTKDDLAFIQAKAVRARIDNELALGAEELVFSGGEPSMRGDLEDLIAFAKHQGCKRIVLETNATLISPSRAASLRRAGVDLARVHLSGWGPDLDRMTREKGSFEATLRGLDALITADCPVEISAAIVRSTASMLPSLPSHLAEHFGHALQGLALVVPVQSPDPTELLPYPEIAPLIVQIEKGCRHTSIPLRFLPGSPPPPCIFLPLQRPPLLYSLSTGSSSTSVFKRVDDCEICQIKDRCNGIPQSYLNHFPKPKLYPIQDERTRRRLSMIGSVREQIKRELVSPTLTRSLDQRLELTIRIQFQCNQRCHFCFVSTHLPHPPEEQVREAIQAAAQQDAKIILSGGEPTLNPKLPGYLRLAHSLSPLPIQLQTNAVRLADRQLCRELQQAGMEEAFVSLHGSCAEISDAITLAPGTFDKTILGINHLLEGGTKVTLNFVICTINLNDIVAYTEMVSSRWPTIEINFSFIAPSTDVVPADRSSIPRYSDAIPSLVEAIQLATSRGITVSGLDSMCGIPVCLVPSELRNSIAPNEIPEGFDEGEFIKTETCIGCSYSRRCFGIRRKYAKIYGTDELRKIH